MSDQNPIALETRSERHVFLERRGYRQRRFIDAARMLPIVGLLLFFVPLVWPRAHQEGPLSTSAATLYIFAIWIVLILLGAFLAWKMTPNETADPTGLGNTEIETDADKSVGSNL